MHTFLHEWEARERERELFPCHISQSTHDILMDVGLLNFYRKGTSLKGNSLCWTKICIRPKPVDI
jgi:hypothetical protein